MFTFFLKSYRSGILTFCGTNVEVDFDINGDEGKYCFRKYENGQYKKEEIPKTRHSNILKGVLIGKKSWGLWKDQWTDGINDWTFTKEEIFKEFEDKGIIIPLSFIKEFENLIEKKRKIRNQNYYTKCIIQNV